MINLGQYIVEKLHLNKDINVKDDAIFDEIADFINDYMQGTCRLKTTDFIWMFEDDKGVSINKDESKLDRIYLYSKKESFQKDIDRIAKDIESGLNKIKKVKKTEVFATSIYFYFNYFKYEKH